MSITVANIVAQIGADLTQFKLGMNEVDARLNLVDVRARQTAQRVDSMRARAAQLDKISANSAKYAKDLAVTRDGYMKEGYAIDLVRAKLKDQIAMIEAKARAEVVAAGTTKEASAAAMKSIDEQIEQIAALSAQYKEYGIMREQITQRMISNDQRSARAINIANNATNRSQYLRGAAGNIEERAGAYAALDTAIAARRKQDSIEHRTRAVNAIAGGIQMAGVVGVGALVAATIAGGNFNQMLLTTAHNTQLSASGIELMNSTVKKFGMESGASLDDLAQGFRKFNDFGYSAQDTVKLLHVAMMASIATGTDIVTTSQILAGSMKNFKIPVQDAAKAMGMMVAAGQESTLTMQELIDKAGPLYATASAMGLSFLQTNAMLVLFTKHQLDASQATTQLRNDINKISNPTKVVRDQLGLLTKETGVNLTNAFTIPGVRALGLIGVFDKLSEAYDKLTPKQRKMWDVQQPSDLAARLFPNMRGTVGGIVAAGNNSELHQQIDKLTSASQAGANINKMYTESLKNITQQMGTLTNAGTILASDISTSLTPQIVKLIGGIDDVVKWFNQLPKGEQDTIVKTIELTSFVALAVGTVGKLAIGISQVGTAIAIFKEKEAAAKITQLELNTAMGTSAVGGSTIAKVFGASLMAIGWLYIADRIVDIGTHFWQMNDAISAATDSTNRLNDAMSKIGNDGPAGSILANKMSIQAQIRAKQTDILNTKGSTQDLGLNATSPANMGFGMGKISDFGIGGTFANLIAYGHNYGSKYANNRIAKDNKDISILRNELLAYPSDNSVFQTAHQTYIKKYGDNNNPLFYTGAKLVAYQKHMAAISAAQNDGGLYGNTPGVAPPASTLDFGSGHKKKTIKPAWYTKPNWYDNIRSDSATWENGGKSRNNRGVYYNANGAIVGHVGKYGDGYAFGSAIHTPNNIYQMHVPTVQGINMPTTGYGRFLQPNNVQGFIPGSKPANKALDELKKKEDDETQKVNDILQRLLYKPNDATDETNKRNDALGELIEKIKEASPTIFGDPNQKDQQNKLINDATDMFNKTYQSDSQIEEGKKLIEIQKQIIQGTKDIAQSMKHSTDAIKITDEQWSKLSKDQQLALDKLKNMNDIKDTITAAMQGTANIFENSLTRLREHGFKGFFKSVEQDFETMLFNLATKWLTSQFLSLMMNQLPSIMSMLGFAGNGGASSAASNMLSSSMNNTGYAWTGLAIGGPIVKGQRYLVGEKGPEYITAREDGYVTSNDKSFGGNNVTVIQHNLINTHNAESFARTPSQNGMRAAQASKLAYNRNR